jgi:hypothetical protein
LPTLSFEIGRFPIVDIALPQTYSFHNNFSLSMGMGGITLFDIREGHKISHLNNVCSLKSKYFEDNPNFLGVQTV